MVNIYTDGKKHLDMQFKSRLERDRKAKSLRKEGWTVKCSKVGFSDLARTSVYILEAKK